MAENLFNETYITKCVEDQLVEGKNHVRAVVVGDMAAGKSHLVNLILNKKIAEEGGDPCRKTEKAKEYERSTIYNGKEYKMTVVDTLGLDDPDEENPIVTLCDNLKGCDLMVYCISVASRISKGTVKILKDLNRARGEDLWKKTLIVFTRVNTNPQFNQEAWEGELKKRFPEISESAHFANSGDEECITVKAELIIHQNRGVVCWFAACIGCGSVGVPALVQLLISLLRNEKVRHYLFTKMPIDKIVTNLPTFLSSKDVTTLGYLGLIVGYLIANQIYREYYSEQ